MAASEARIAAVSLPAGTSGAGKVREPVPMPCHSGRALVVKVCGVSSRNTLRR